MSTDLLLNNLEINQEAAIELLLKERFLSEFQNIDGIFEHPKALNFYEWLFKKGLITRYNLDSILTELKEKEKQVKQ